MRCHMDSGGRLPTITMKQSSSIQPAREVLAELHESAYRWALVCCGMDADGARETMQTVYLEILTGRASFHGEASLKTWLFAVVRNTALRLANGHRRERARVERLAALDAAATAADGGLEQAVAAQTRRRIAAALRRLPSRQRLIVELVYFHELSVAEAAAVMGIAVGSARQHFHRAKRALAAVLRPLREGTGT